MPRHGGQHGRHRARCVPHPDRETPGSRGTQTVGGGYRHGSVSDWKQASAGRRHSGNQHTVLNIFRRNAERDLGTTGTGGLSDDRRTRNRKSRRRIERGSLQPDVKRGIERIVARDVQHSGFVTDAGWSKFHREAGGSLRTYRRHGICGHHELRCVIPVQGDAESSQAAVAQISNDKGETRFCPVLDDSKRLPDWLPVTVGNRKPCRLFHRDERRLGAKSHQAHHEAI